MTDTLTILTNDPSSTAWGWAVIRNGTILDRGCIKTKPCSKKMRIRRSDDRAQRAETIAATLRGIILTYGVNYITAEAPSGSQSSAAAVMIGMVIGILVTTSVSTGIPLEWYSENDVKQHLLQRNSATKLEVMEQVELRTPWRRSGVAVNDEAVADAIGVYLVALRKSQALAFILSKY